eukprot:11179433-Lingulodinium_polyedra.AAC.1
MLPRVGTRGVPAGHARHQQLRALGAPTLAAAHRKDRAGAHGTKTLRTLLPHALLLACRRRFAH